MATTGSAAPISAARFVISFDDVEVEFSELTGISSEVEPAEDTPAGSTGTTVSSKTFGNASPPTVTLRRASMAAPRSGPGTKPCWRGTPRRARPAR